MRLGLAQGEHSDHVVMLRAFEVSCGILEREREKERERREQEEENGEGADIARLM